ncbi:MAG: hypothetical protein ACREK5_07060 [Gemmatimonadota bacterium]
MNTHRLMALTVLASTLGSPAAIAAQGEIERRLPRATVLRSAPPPQADFAITTKIEPAEHLGPCPAKVAFIATITAKKAGPVRFKLHTSDNAYDPVREMMFVSPSTKSFAVTRNLPPPGSGWGAFELVGPVSASSEKAYYDIKCTNDPRSPSSARPPRPQPPGERSPTLGPPATGQLAIQAPRDLDFLIPKPDLVITAVTGSHVKGQGGLVWKFLVEVTNQGPTEASGSFLCAHENPALAAQASKNPIPKLGANQSAKIEYWYGKPTWWFVQNGERKKRPLVFVADCLGSMPEGNESNNQYPIWLYWDPTEAKTWEPAEL